MADATETAGGGTAATRVPAPAAWLGGAGLIPFAGLAVLVWAVPGAAGPAATALTAYGAAILAFMGGCRWGFSAVGMGGGPRAVDLAVSVVPALYAWAAVMAEPRLGMLLLAAGFAALLAADVALARRGGAPAWWPRLRWPLTAGAVLSLAAGAAGAPA